MTIPEPEMAVEEKISAEAMDEVENEKQITIQFVAEGGDTMFQPFEVPRDITPQKLLLVLNAFFSDEEDKNRPYLFFVNEQEIRGIQFNSSDPSVRDADSVGSGISCWIRNSRPDLDPNPVLPYTIISICTCNFFQ
jgi:NLE (NUC135) domain